MFAFFRAAFGDNFHFMDDNTPYHRANIVQDYLESVGFYLVMCPARSPDLYPIENVWIPWGEDLLLAHILPQTSRPIRAVIQGAPKSHGSRHSKNATTHVWKTALHFMVSVSLTDLSLRIAYRE